LALLQVIAYHPAVAMRAMIRARRAWSEKPPIDDDLEP
jgi:hypothetical protein